MSDTIFALASGAPPAAISIVRASGPAAHTAGEALAGSLPEPRQAALRSLCDGDGALLDEALVLRFDGPASSTGEDLVEFHCHGGRAVVESVLAALAGQPGLRPAQPGEFTRRAFENGRIDLIEAEGLADLIEAETQSQRRAALLLAEGALSKRIGEWQQQVLDLAARAEAAIDYVDEDSADADPALNRDCGSLANTLSDWLARPRAEVLKDGVLVVIAGPPNVGKSSLLNALTGSERAIVTDVPGTTRDHIEVPLAISGVPLRLTDTAGLRESHDQVERIGVDRARTLIQAAGVVLWLGDPADAPDRACSILVHPRADLPGRKQAKPGALAVSSVTGIGLDALSKQIVAYAGASLPGEGEFALNRRQAECLTAARCGLEAAAKADDVVLLAESLRGVRTAFDRLTGRPGVEDMLDALFGRFCLGK